MKSPVRDPLTSMPIVPPGIAISRVRASDRPASARLYLLDSRMLLDTHQCTLMDAHGGSRMRAIVTPAIPTRLWNGSAVHIIGADVGRGGSHFAVTGLVERFSLSRIHLLLTGKIQRWFYILHELVQPHDPASGNLEGVILIGESSIDFEACRIAASLVASIGLGRSHEVADRPRRDICVLGCGPPEPPHIGVSFSSRAQRSFPPANGTLVGIPIRTFSV